jgi:hypothetical protein
MCGYVKTVCAEQILVLRNLRQRVFLCYTDNDSEHALSFLGCNGISFDACRAAVGFHIETYEGCHKTFSLVQILNQHIVLFHIPLVVNLSPGSYFFITLYIHMVLICSKEYTDRNNNEDIFVRASKITSRAKVSMRT